MDDEDVAGEPSEDSGSEYSSSEQSSDEDLIESDIDNIENANEISGKEPKLRKRL